MTDTALVGELLPIGRREARTSVKVSLRGTLAQQLADVRETGLPGDAEALVRQLLFDPPSEITSYVDGETVVIGKTAERGMFWPDW